MEYYDSKEGIGRYSACRDSKWRRCGWSEVHQALSLSTSDCFTSGLYVPCLRQQRWRHGPEAAAVTAVPLCLRLQLIQLAPALQVRYARRAQLAPGGMWGRCAGLGYSSTAADVTCAGLDLLLFPLVSDQRQIELAKLCKLVCRDVHEGVARACTGRGARELH